MARKSAAPPAIRGKYLTVPVEDLQPNPRNPNRQSKLVKDALIESIRQHGFTDPIVARRLPGGELEIIGGEHRWRAAQTLGMTEVPVIDIGDVPDYMANLHMVALNELKGTHDQDALAAILQDAKEQGGDAALVVIPFSEAQWAELLDEEPVPVDDDAPPPPAGPMKLKATDIMAVLELSASDQAAVTQFIEGVRLWARTRPPKAPPAWQGILEQLEG
jgi:hypothetical protein